jgi:hypothetical protein
MRDNTKTGNRAFSYTPSSRLSGTGIAVAAHVEPIAIIPVGSADFQLRD